MGCCLMKWGGLGHPPALLRSVESHLKPGINALISSRFVRSWVTHAHMTDATAPTLLSGGSPAFWSDICTP